MTLFDLFQKCISVPYENAGVSASYAFKRVGGTLFVFFQGSDGKNDWLRNFNFPAKPYKRMGKTVWFAHRGFLKTWKEIEPKLAPELLDKSVDKIVISGYSHGGALAMLCHEYAWYHRADLRARLETYAFGAPRVFWGVKTNELKKRWNTFTLVRNLNDFITHLPPSFLGFSHMGRLLKIGQRGKYTPIQAHLSQNISTELKAIENAPLRERKKQPCMS